MTVDASLEGAIDSCCMISMKQAGLIDTMIMPVPRCVRGVGIAELDGNEMCVRTAQRIIG